MKNGWSARDEYLTRYSAKVVAQYSEKTAVALNDLSPISENRVWHQVLQAKKSPANFKADYQTAMGIEEAKLGVGPSKADRGNPMVKARRGNPGRDSLGQVDEWKRFQNVLACRFSHHHSPADHPSLPSARQAQNQPFSQSGRHESDPLANTKKNHYDQGFRKPETSTIRT